MCLCVSSINLISRKLGTTGVTELVCELAQHISFPLWFIVVFNEASQGLMVFFIFGTSWRLFKGWYNLFTNPRAIWGNPESKSSAGSQGGSSTSLRKIQGKRVTRTSAEGNEMIEELDNSISRDDDTSSSSSSDNATANKDGGEEKGDQTDVEISEMSEN